MNVVTTRGSASKKQLVGASVSYQDGSGAIVETTLDAAVADRVVTGMPVRRIRSHARQRNYCGWFWSTTTGGHLVYESRLELDRLLLADFDPDVVWIATQPFWLGGQDGESFRRHVPDVMLKLASGRFTVVDVKPLEFQSEPDVAKVLDWTSRACAAKGWRYEVYGGGDDGVVLANIRHLAYARRDYLLAEREMQAAAALNPAGRPWGEVANDLTAAGCRADDAAISAMLWGGKWRTDLHRPLGRSSVLEAV